MGKFRLTVQKDWLLVDPTTSTSYQRVLVSNMPNTKTLFLSLTPYSTLWKIILIVQLIIVNRFYSLSRSIQRKEPTNQRKNVKSWRLSTVGIPISSSLILRKPKLHSHLPQANILSLIRTEYRDRMICNNLKIQIKKTMLSNFHGKWLKHLLRKN